MQWLHQLLESVLMRRERERERERGNVWKHLQRGTALKRLVMNWKWWTYCGLLIDPALSLTFRANANTCARAHTHAHTHTHSPCSHLPFRRGCGYLTADCWLPPSSQWLTCFPLWQQMVQPPLHYSCSLFLLIYPCFSSLATCLSLLIFPVSMSLFVLSSAPFVGLLVLLPPLCVCLSLWLAEGCLCYI